MIRQVLFQRKGAKAQRRKKEKTGQSSPSSCVFASSCAFALKISILAGLTACSGTGQPEVTYQASAQVIPAQNIQAGDWTVSLTQGTLAFGPAYFCAAASGSADLCETALGELRTIRAIDLTDPSPQPLGEAHGLTGVIRSASYDFGIHWFLTEEAPIADPAAPSGHSATLAGKAQKGNRTVTFTAEVDVIPQFQGQRAVPSAAASATIDQDQVALTVGFDPGAWLSQVDFDEAPDGAKTYVIAPGSRNHGALVIAMTAQKPPSFTWAKAP
ncbi:MAG: hypothetical protein U0359_21080 [Byssovorax sp.]